MEYVYKESALEGFRIFVRGKYIRLAAHHFLNLAIQLDSALQEKLQMASSLEILRPSPSPTNETHSIGSLAKDLEDKSSTLIKLMSKRDWSHPDVQQYIDSSTWLPQQPFTVSGKAAEPEIISVSAEVREEEGRASVWMLIALPNDTHGLERESIAVMQWKLTGGSWKCYEQTASYGGSSFGI